VTTRVTLHGIIWIDVLAVTGKFYFARLSDVLWWGTS